MKQKPIYGLLIISTLWGCSIVQEEIATIDIETLTESEEDLKVYSSGPVHIELDEKIFFWSDFDIEYSGNLKLYFQVQVKDSSGRPMGLFKMDPLNIDTRIMCVERSSQEKTSYSCTGKIHDFYDPKGLDYLTFEPAGEYIFDVIMVAREYEYLDLNEAKLIIKK